MAPPLLSCTLSPPLIALLLPFSQAYDKDVPLDAEHVKTAESLNSTRSVSSAVKVTVEIGSVQIKTHVLMQQQHWQSDASSTSVGLKKLFNLLEGRFNQ